MICILAASTLCPAAPSIADADKVDGCLNPSLSHASNIATCTLAFDTAPDDASRAEAINSRGTAQFNAGDLVAAEADFLTATQLALHAFGGFHNIFLIADGRNEDEAALR